MVNDILSLENSNIRNQYDSSTTNFYPDFELNPPSYYTVNSDLQDYSTNNLMFYHQTQEAWKEK
jgi:hypothetical protein